MVQCNIVVDTNQLQGVVRVRALTVEFQILQIPRQWDTLPVLGCIGASHACLLRSLKATCLILLMNNGLGPRLDCTTIAVADRQLTGAWMPHIFPNPCLGISLWWIKQCLLMSWLDKIGNQWLLTRYQATKIPPKKADKEWLTCSLYLTLISLTTHRLWIDINSGQGYSTATVGRCPVWLSLLSRNCVPRWKISSKEQKTKCR